MKKAFTRFLALTCAAALSVPTVAQRAPVADLQKGQVISHQIDAANIPVYTAPSPRFANIESISARMVQEKGKSTITGTVLTDDPSYKTTLSITVQRSSDGKNWKDVKTWSTYSEENDVLIIEKTYYLAPGYSYRSVTQATVDSGTTIEVVSATSATVYY